MKIYKEISQLITLKEAAAKDGRNLNPSDLSIIENAAIVFNDEQILWLGKNEDLPSEFSKAWSISLKDHTLMPEIVDSHTHTVFGGDRSFEYSMRLNGSSYEEIANKGGGILNTMSATNTASSDELFIEAKKRIEQIHSYGIGTIEIKSGYGLTFDKEKEISMVINKLKDHFSPNIQIFNTYLAAHAIPKEFKSSAKYMDDVVLPLLAEIKDTVDAVDIFHEKNYFNEKDCVKLFEYAKNNNILIKSHADELNDNNGASLAVKYNAVSADHLLATSEAGIKDLASSNTVATLLPGTAFFLGKPLADARKFLDAGCKVALASDYNPGSCHCDNLVLLACLSAKNLNMNIAEVWSSITLNSAHALGIKDQGVLEVGMKPRFSVFNCSSIDKILYNWGMNLAVNI